MSKRHSSKSLSIQLSHMQVERLGAEHMVQCLPHSLKKEDAEWYLEEINNIIQSLSFMETLEKENKLARNSKGEWELTV